MTPAALLARLARLAAARPGAVLAVTLALAAAGGALALGLEPSAGTGTLVSRGAPSARASAELHRRFGDDAVVVLVRERLVDLIDTADLGRLVRLEGCLGGNVPRGGRPYGPRGGPCWRLAATQPVHVVYGPGTFLNEAVNAVAGRYAAILRAGERRVARAARAARELALARGRPPAEADRLAREAARLAQAQVTADLARLAVASGIQGLPRLDDSGFVNQVVFDPARGYDTPKARFAYLFPSPRTALVQVRLRPGLSDPARARAIALIRRATALPAFRLAHGGSYTVTGVPVVVSDLSGRIAGSLGRLLAAAALVMALVLLVVFRAPLRLLPLVVALAAAGLTFGAMALVGATLTMASIAVLPVLVGLAVDYAIQFQARVPKAPAGVARGAAAAAPTIAAAGLATAVGFLVLLLSPVPMVRGFGALLVLGVALGLACAFSLGAAALALLGPGAGGAAARRARAAGDALGAATRGARDIVLAVPGARARARAAARMGGAGEAALAGAARRPGRVLACALALAAVGWAVESRTEVVSDVTRLVPQDLGALRDVRALQRATGIAGEIDVLVQARDVTDARVVRWMTRYEHRALARFGYREVRGCRAARLCPALSLPDLFSTRGAASSTTGVRRLLAAVPPYFSRAVVSGDRRAAALAFGIRLEPLAEQERVVDELRRRLHPPPGVSARLAGLPVLAADANARLADPWRRLGTLAAGLVAVALALATAFRSLRRALVPLVPIVLATGWSALVLFLTRVPLNPMSATLGVLVVAIATEFSVLLAERHRLERAAGLDLHAALRRTWRSTGAAVLASGVTAIAGFGVLVASDVAMLRDFGLVCVLDLAVALAGALVVLPAVLVLAERPPERRPARRALAVRRPRRRATVA